MAIQHENILKIADIHYSQFSSGFIGFIAKQLPTYKDYIMEEDIFSPEDLKDANPDIPDELETTLAEIRQLMQQHHCGYFRIIYT